MQFPRAISVSIYSAVMLVALACTQDHTTAPSPTPTSTAATPSTPAALPAIVQRVLTAVQANDTTTLTSLIEYQHAPCAPNSELGGPPTCKHGDAIGTIATVFPVGNCEGGWADAPVTFTDLARASAGIYAVTTINTSATNTLPYWPSGSYLIAFNSIGPFEPAWMLILSDTAIVRSHLSCSAFLGHEQESASTPSTAIAISSAQRDNAHTRVDSSPCSSTPRMNRQPP